MIPMEHSAVAVVPASSVLPRTERTARRADGMRWGVIAAVALICGCGGPAGTPQPGPLTRWVAAQVAVEQSPAIPPAQPQGASPPASKDTRQRPADEFDDAAAPQKEPAPAGNLIGNLRDFIQSSEVLESAGGQSGLIEMLDEAESNYSRIKEQNREALRNLNRQIRVGAASTSPNLILVQISRSAWDAWGCYGGEPTPTIDRLAAEGMRFTDFYAGSADLGKSRWCLLTGSGGGRTSPKEPDKQLAGNARTLPELLWLGGYSTAFVGSWGLPSSPLDCGYEEFTGFLSDSDCEPYPESIAVDRSRLKLLPNAQNAQGVHADQLLLNESLNFLDRARDRRRHFFLHVVWPTFPSTSHRSSDTNAARLDRFLAALTRTLDERGLDSRVALFLTAESGPLVATSAGAFRPSPHGLGEGNLRIPLIVRWPGKVRPGTTGALHALWDLPATFAEIAILTRKPGGGDGRSLLPTLQERAPSDRELLYWKSDDGSAQAVRLNEWKGILLAGKTGVSLHHLGEDRSESQDVAAQNPDIVRRLLAPSAP